MIAPVIADRDDPDRLPPLDRMQTGRLQLRMPRLADADAIAEGLSTYAIARMLPLIPWPYDRQDALDWLLPRTTGMLPGWSLAVTPDGERYLGTVSIDRVEGRWSLGYWLGVNHWGRGVISEAVRALVQRFFDEKPDEILHSSVLADNPASLALQRRLGFRIVGWQEVFCNPRGRMERLIETALDPQSFGAAF